MEKGNVTFNVYVEGAPEPATGIAMEESKKFLFLLLTDQWNSGHEHFSNGCYVGLPLDRITMIHVLTPDLDFEEDDLFS